MCATQLSVCIYCVSPKGFLWVGWRDAMEMGDSTHHLFCLATLLWLLMALAIQRATHHHHFSPYCVLRNFLLIYLTHAGIPWSKSTNTTFTLSFLCGYVKKLNFYLPLKIYVHHNLLKEIVQYVYNMQSSLTRRERKESLLFWEIFTCWINWNVFMPNVYSEHLVSFRKLLRCN